MKINDFKIGMWTLLLLFAACDNKDLPIDAEGDFIRLYSMANQPVGAEAGESGQQKAVLLFWELDDFNDGAYGLPFLVAKPEQGINAYQTTPFNTHKFYPPKDNILAAVGYSPQELVSSTANGKEDFVELTLPVGKHGPTTDLLTSVSPMYGSASNPFDKAGRNETLKFMHAQSKVTFKAKLKESMDLAIRNVRIELDPIVVTGSLEWNGTAKKYVTKAGTEAFSFGQVDTSTPLTKGTPADVGTVYLLAGLTKVPVKITVDKSDDNFKSSQTTTFPAVLDFTISRDASVSTDQDKEANRLYAGEAYTFTLFFDRSTLTLVGKMVPWEEGGQISIPIYPNVSPTP